MSIKWSKYTSYLAKYKLQKDNNILLERSISYRALEIDIFRIKKGTKTEFSDQPNENPFVRL